MVGRRRIAAILVRDAMTESTMNLAAMADALARSETTGLDTRKNEIIELGMVKFDYLPDGRIAGVRDVFSSFNEPTGPISDEVTALTGITTRWSPATGSTMPRSLRSSATQ